MLDAQTSFLAWGERHKDNLPAQTRGSMEHMLRYEELERELMEEELPDLNSEVSKLILYAQRNYNPSLAGLEGEFTRVIRVVKELVEVSDLKGFMNNLDVALSDEEDSTVGDEWGLGIWLEILQIGRVVTSKVERFEKYASSLYESQDWTEESKRKLERESELDRVVEMVRQWRALANSDPNMNDEATASNSVTDIMWFCERLALANAKRRKDIQDPDHPLNWESAKTAESFSYLHFPKLRVPSPSIPRTYSMDGSHTGVTSSPVDLL
ncbi:uncharacterized protein KD926_002611 [Aspergillus affinis]|uniref:uncharacterized protein n=1 Tax=Aspergillus affinis TaxID=1070780 RepID=UPI0022FE4AC1|nr:uncharacterized protein KD926_002611 [Aspergillus affinis]KAI9035946.1 hypothetical protein KD926_002611 [Aspergillus affinis]